MDAILSTEAGCKRLQPVMYPYNPQFNAPRYWVFGSNPGARCQGHAAPGWEKQFMQPKPSTMKQGESCAVEGKSPKRGGRFFPSSPHPLLGSRSDLPTAPQTPHRATCLEGPAPTCKIRRGRKGKKRHRLQNSRSPPRKTTKKYNKITKRTKQTLAPVREPTARGAPGPRGKTYRSGSAATRGGTCRRTAAAPLGSDRLRSAPLGSAAGARGRGAVHKSGRKR